MLDILIDLEQPGEFDIFVPQTPAAVAFCAIQLRVWAGGATNAGQRYIVPKLGSTWVIKALDSKGLKYE